MHLKYCCLQQQNTHTGNTKSEENVWETCTLWPFLHTGEGLRPSPVCISICILSIAAFSSRIHTQETKNQRKMYQKRVLYVHFCKKVRAFGPHLCVLAYASSVLLPSATEYTHRKHKIRGKCIRNVYFMAILCHRIKTENHRNF